ncbi:DUF3422 domain-containing protein [Limnohabitans sp.]|jgi:uncharacterized membrane-anchored protein|uniref:DUF3422 family protein n=1 Tax=Limnohabitans sp. TaxID=1907725 RepID=UPI001B4595F9|nr:DUF3422 domain-containing protein [Limnohabitans sp.]MBP6244254.1 DUF3422 domain-containing protein [Limnohabitans sp.]
MNEMNARYLPLDDEQRRQLHNEVHARPSARVRLPALIVYVAVLNEGVGREQEWQHLKDLPGHADLALDRLNGNFLRLRCDGFTVKWERHTEFTRYSIVQPLPAHAGWGSVSPELASQVVTGTAWLRAIPGKTVAAIHLGMLAAPVDAPDTVAQAQAWLGEGAVVGSRMGNTTEGLPHSCVLTHFRLGADGFERMLVLAPADTSEARAGRISQRLLELETYRLMALRGLPVAKALSPVLSDAEAQLAEITARLERKEDSDQALLDVLVSLAARIERATAEHGYRFSATRAYDTLVSQRIAELRERPIAGTQTVGEFMQRRLSPAMATVAATSQRLSALSERVSRTSALLRTRVDIATETQNQVLLEKLTRGQDLQLRLQSTVEGLSIAAISYYVVSLVLYGAKALDKLGMPVNPEMAAGLSIPLVLWGVWRTTRRIHARLNQTAH